MKKLLIFIITLCLCTWANAAQYYNPDLQAAYNNAVSTCKSAPNETIFPNPVDGTTFFQCYNGSTMLIPCATGLFYNAQTNLCEPIRSAEDMLYGIDTNAYTSYCDSSSTCDCRDNPHNYTKNAGTCGCDIMFPEVGFGLSLNYDTCVASPSCDVMRDTGGTNRATYHPTTLKCYVPTGYTFGDDSGNFTFTNNCYAN